jgi:AraC-like DNA-binding protein
MRDLAAAADPAGSAPGRPDVTAPTSALEFFAAKPRPPLDTFVEVIWGTRGPAPYRRAMVLPNGALRLMMNFGAAHRLLRCAGRDLHRGFAGTWVAGMQDQPLAIESPPVTEIFAVRLRPGGAHAFFGQPLFVLSNDVVAAEDWLRADADGLRDRVAACPTWPGRAAAAGRWLLERLAPREPDAAIVRRAVQALDRPHRAAAVGAACAALGLSNRQVIELCRRHAGVTPKTFARVRRCHRALAALARGQPRADLAAELGYADQTHCGNELRRLAGVTPGQFLARRGLDNESVILG